MPLRRLPAYLAALLLVSPGLALATAAPASAHGAPEEPLSRLLACAPGSEHEQSEVCQAALNASGRFAFDDWDNLRVPGVGGADRELIPDGALCSAGLDQFAGLNLARPDWPATTVDDGAEITVTYRVTIPHQGTFRLYLTVDGFNPDAPLSWADLESEPFLTVTDPELVDGAYLLAGELPAGRSGRHILYTVWQNTDTPDTYYSCADLVVDAPEPGPAPPTGDAEPVAPLAGAAAIDRAPGNAELLPRLLVAAGVALALLTVTVAWQFRRRAPAPRRR